MIKLTSLLPILLAALCCATGCDKSKADAPAADATPAKAAEADAKPTKGMVLMADGWVKVGPFISRDARSDLRTHCIRATEKAKEEGADRPLCFAEGATTKPTIARIEYIAGVSYGVMIKWLDSRHEATHFIISQTRGLWQLLDVAHSARRDGAFHPGEIRIMSGNEAGHKMLAEALVEAWPGLKVEVVAAAAELKSAEDKTPAPATPPMLPGHEAPPKIPGAGHNSHGEAPSKLHLPHPGDSLPPAPKTKIPEPPR